MVNNDFCFNPLLRSSGIVSGEVLAGNGEHLEVWDGLSAFKYPKWWLFGISPASTRNHDESWIRDCPDTRPGQVWLEHRTRNSNSHKGIQRSTCFREIWILTSLSMEPGNWNQQNYGSCRQAHMECLVFVCFCVSTWQTANRNIVCSTGKRCSSS